MLSTETIKFIKIIIINLGELYKMAKTILMYLFYIYIKKKQNYKNIGKLQN